MAAAKTSPLTDREFALARVLLVDVDPASRLTLQTILRAGGYRVDTAASAAEATQQLDEKVFELVLSGLDLESPEAGLKVIGHARLMAYKPASALLAAYEHDRLRSDGPVLIESEDVPELLTKVANLIGERAQKQVARQLRRNGN